MNILGIETSTGINSVAVLCDKRILAEITQNNGDSQSALLAGNIKEVLLNASLDLNEINGIAVSLGPGSFTALRVGVSYAKGLAFASGIKIAGVPALDAQAFRFYEGKRGVQEAYGTRPELKLICPMGDARKNEVYYSAYTEKDGELLKLLPESCAGIEKAIAVLAALGAKELIFQGEGAVKYSSAIKALLGECCLAPEKKLYPSAVSVAELGAFILKQGQAPDFGSLLPLYVRKSDAELGIK